MNYYVEWTPAAHDRLEQLWVAAANQAAVVRAANVIDDYLAEDPYRSEAVRISSENTFIVEPLAVDFRILEAERRVAIISVWMIGFLENGE